MNLENRITKLENNSKVKSNVFCNCLRNHSETLLQDKTGQSIIWLKVPDKCELCNKPIQKTSLVIKGIEGNEKPE